MKILLIVIHILIWQPILTKKQFDIKIFYKNINLYLKNFTNINNLKILINKKIITNKLSKKIIKIFCFYNSKYNFNLLLIRWYSDVFIDESSENFMSLIKYGEIIDKINNYKEKNEIIKALNEIVNNNYLVPLIKSNINIYGLKNHWFPQKLLLDFLNKKININNLDIDLLKFLLIFFIYLIYPLD